MKKASAGLLNDTDELLNSRTEKADRLTRRASKADKVTFTCLPEQHWYVNCYNKREDHYGR